MRQSIPAQAREKIIGVVRRIPMGSVATYGQVAVLAGLPRRARLVGRVLRGLEDDGVPWHRVVNAGGRVSVRSDGMGAEQLQRALLEAEGIVFSAAGRIDLEQHGWDAPVGALRGGVTS